MRAVCNVNRVANAVLHAGKQEGFLGEVTSELLLSKMILERNVRGAHMAEEPGEAWIH